MHGLDHLVGELSDADAALQRAADDLVVDVGDVVAHTYMRTCWGRSALKVSTARESVLWMPATWAGWQSRGWGFVRCGGGGAPARAPTARGGVGAELESNRYGGALRPTPVRHHALPSRRRVRPAAALWPSCCRLRGPRRRAQEVQRLHAAARPPRRWNAPQADRELRPGCGDALPMRRDAGRAAGRPARRKPSNARSRPPELEPTGTTSRRGSRRATRSAPRPRSTRPCARQPDAGHVHETSATCR